MVLNLEVGGDQWWGLTPDPCGEWLGSFSLVILYYLDLKMRGGQKSGPRSYMITASI